MNASTPRAQALTVFERTVTLRDGARVRLRAIRPEDEPRLIALYDRLSHDTRYHRFFSVMRKLPPDWARFLAHVDYQRRFALVAESPADPDALIAVARYEPTGEPGAAEVAFVVEDGWQGRGLGSALFGELLRAAAAAGVTRFRAWVLADNRRMLDMIARFADVVDRRIEQGVVELVFVARPAAPGAGRAGA